METQAHMSSEKKHLIMKRRSADLSKAIIDNKIADTALDVLVFKLAEELYAIETKYIREVYPLKDYTVLPGTPKFIFGLINLRRKIISVIDLKVLFDLPESLDMEKKVIILEDGQKEFAILSNGIIGMQKIPIEDVQNTMPTLSEIRQDFLKGVSNDGIALLDGAKLLYSKQIVVDETVDL
ncbi:MAG: chemotaxis protein CheW [Chlamydiales bacterium]|nr:chemotaxis protein CheW [Chlamydiales bacterium]